MQPFSGQLLPGVSGKINEFHDHEPLLYFFFFFLWNELLSLKQFVWDTMKVNKAIHKNTDGMFTEVLQAEKTNQ